ncbi:MAG: membrane protein insertase YidC, partial [Sedimenticolaceae bacterium]
MDNVRLLLFMALAFIGMLIYQAWQQDYGPRNQIAAQQPVQPSTVFGETPDAPQRADIDSAMPNLPGETPATAAANARLIKVRTDTLDLAIDTRGGTIVDARLMQYPVAVNQPDVKYRLLSQRPSDYFIAQSGLLGADKERTPTHEALFSTEAE